MQRAAVYCRISEDRTGEAEGVERQLEDCLARIEADPELMLAGEPYVDNDLSAAKGDERPQYDAMMDAVRHGEVDTIVCWMQSRLWRNRKERAGSIEELAPLRTRIIIIRGADLDMSNAAGRLVAGLVGEMDSFESEVKGERVARAAQQRAEKGRPNGGTRRYGFTAKGHEIIPEEADIIRECARRVIAGQTVTAATHWLNDHNVPPARAAKWERTSLRNVLLSPAVAGRRHHRGIDVGPAAWGAILDDVTVATLKEVLKPKQLHAGSNTAKYLLAGLALCGAPLREGRQAGHPRYDDLCGSRLWSHSTPDRHGNGTRYRAYTCLPIAEGGCRGVSRAIEHADRHVERLVVGRLKREDVRLQLVSGGAPDASEVFEVERGVKALEDRLVDIAVEFSDRTDEIGRRQFRAADLRLRAQLEDLLAQRDRLARRSTFGDLVGVEDIDAYWADRLLPGRRRLIRALADVVILPAGRDPRFNPDLVQVLWHDLGGA